MKSFLPEPPSLQAQKDPERESLPEKESLPAISRLLGARRCPMEILGLSH